jgi:glycosyltransferase involved in cell wall biosynthesis
MMHIFLNAAGASAGSGLTYLYNVLPRLSSMPDVRTTLAVQEHLRAGFQGLTSVDVLDAAIPESSLRRFWFEQKELPKLIAGVKADVLVSAGNFAIRNSPVPQLLLSGNSLYTSTDFYRDLRRRGEYRMWLDTKIRGIFAKRSVQWADCTVAPSRAFANELHRWTGREVRVVYHGFTPKIFFADRSPLPVELQQRLATRSDCVRLLFVSHYNYYRNFETLFRGVAGVRARLNGRKLKLFLTCTLEDDKTPGSYKTGRAARLIQDLGIRDEVVELGAVPYALLHQVYRSCDIYVTAAYAETFAHPLVEAMACGLPVVASDIAVHREVCGESGIYFSRFSADDLASTLLRQMDSHPAGTGSPGTRFSWDRHVEQILAIAVELLGSPVHRSGSAELLSPADQDPVGAIN